MAFGCAAGVEQGTPNPGCEPGCPRGPGSLILADTKALESIHVQEMVVGDPGLLLGETGGSLLLLEGEVLEDLGPPAPNAQLKGLERLDAGAPVGCFIAGRDLFVGRFVDRAWQSTRVGSYEDPCRGKDVERACFGAHASACSVREDDAGLLHGLFVAAYYLDGAFSIHADVGKEGDTELRRLSSDFSWLGWRLFRNGQLAILTRHDDHGIVAHGLDEADGAGRYHVWRREPAYGDVGDGTLLTDFDVYRRVVDGRDYTGLVWAELADDETTLFFAYIRDGLAREPRVLTRARGRVGPLNLVLNRRGKPIVTFINAWYAGQESATGHHANLQFDDEETLILDQDFLSGPLGDEKPTEALLYQADVPLLIDDDDGVHVVVNRNVQGSRFPGSVYRHFRPN